MAKLLGLYVAVLSCIIVLVKELSTNIFSYTL